MQQSTAANKPFQSFSMSDKDFSRFSALVMSQCGIKMPPVKKTMLVGRLSKRLRILGINSFSQYYDFVCSAHGQDRELQAMIDAVTTNKTDFFREPRHFNYLVENALPDLMKKHGTGARRKLAVWSAASSSGEEPYTLAMVLGSFSEKHRGFQYELFATDISTKVLKKAVSAIYNSESIAPIPEPFRKKYLLRSKNREDDRFRIVPELRSQVQFQRLNLLDEDYGLRKKFHVVFCRNVLIYFKRSTQEMILNRLCSHLVTGGYLFTGHSETLTGLNVPVVPVSTTVYRKRE